MPIPWLILETISPIQSRSGIDTNQSIVIGSTWYNVFCDEKIAIQATQKPIRFEPLSPKNTPLFLPKNLRLNIKKPITDPIRIISIESYISPE